MGNKLESLLSKIKITQLAILSAPLLFYWQALASPRINVTPSFEPIAEYCKQSRDPNRPITLSEIISRSDLSYEEKRVLELFYEGLSKEELDYICLGQDFEKRIKK